MFYKIDFFAGDGHRVSRLVFSSKDSIRELAERLRQSHHGREVSITPVQDARQVAGIITRLATLSLVLFLQVSGDLIDDDLLRARTSRPAARITRTNRKEA